MKAEPHDTLSRKAEGTSDRDPSVPRLRRVYRTPSIRTSPSPAVMRRLETTRRGKSPDTEMA